MNEFTIVGKVASVPEYDSTSTGTTVVRIALEVERGFSNKNGTRDTDLFRITAFGKTAEELQRIVVFSSLLTVKGRLQASNRISDGKKFFNIELIAEHISYLQ